MLLAHHGPSVYGADLASAADAVEDLGETARLHLLVHDRRRRPLTPEEVPEPRAT
jgi:ribulose-5-phosphate 4-epimerase/fuculose-1-phosphate aldolase